MAAFILARLLQHPLPGAEMAPTFWITLGPVGVGTTGLMGLAETSRALGLVPETGTLNLLAMLLWGFGFWALGVALAVSFHHLLHGGIPFSLSFWAFTFPMAAYTLSTLRVAALLQAPGLAGYAFVLTLLLTGLWLAAARGTLAGLVRGGLFAAPAGRSPWGPSGARAAS